MAQGGRPTKLTPELQTRIVNFLRTGAYVETAAAAAGVSKQTLYDWLKRGARVGRDELGEVTPKDHPDADYARFLDAVEVAQAEADVGDLAIIRKAAQDGYWAAAAWRLERKHPDKWGRREVLALTTAEHQTDELVAAIQDDPEAMEAYHDLLARISGPSSTNGSGEAG